MLIGMTVLAAGSFSTSLAWYISATTLHVEGLDVKIRAERSLHISTSPENGFVDELQTKDLKTVIGDFSPVSTMFESRWRDGNHDPEFYEYRGYYTPSTGIPYAPERITQGFFTQTLYLLADDDVYVTLDPDFLYARAYESANREKAKSLVGTYMYRDFTEEEIFQRLNSVAKAMRLSCYFQDDDQYFIIDPNKEGITYYGGILDTFHDGVFDTFTDSKGLMREVVYGEYNDASFIRYGDKLIEPVEAEGELTCFNAAHAGLCHPFDANASAAAGLRFKEEPSLAPSDFTDDPNPETNSFAVYLERDVPKAFTLSIYLEGWDHNCVNAAMGASFLTGLQFKILREA